MVSFTWATGPDSRGEAQWAEEGGHLSVGALMRHNWTGGNLQEGGYIDI